MKNTIAYQNVLIKKRSNITKAITHNVKYLAKINHNNAMELETARERLDSTLIFNERL